MLNFIKRLDENKIDDLAISIGATDYADLYKENKLIDYKYEDNYLRLSIIDNYINFKDSEGDKLYDITDFTISRVGSNENVEYGFYEFMILEFCDEWYDEALAYLKSQNDLAKIEVLNRAKEEADKMLADDPLSNLLEV